MEGVDLNWKVKTGLLVFAPCTQLTFLGAYIYFWITEKSEQKEVGVVLCNFYLSLTFSNSAWQYSWL